MKTLRPYQTHAIESVRNEIKKGNRRILLAIATGAGKSIIARSIAEMAAVKNNHVLFTAHRTILINQMKDTFKGLSNVTCGTLQSMHKKEHDVKLIISDECHYGSDSKMRSNLPKDVIEIGLSATPINADGSKLDGWDVILDEVQLCDLIEMGYASPVIVKAAIKPDRSKIKIKHGDYDIKGAFDLMSPPEMIGDIIGQYKKHAEGMRTLIFCVNIEHAEEMALAFKREGYRCEAVHSKKKDNIKLIDDFKSGDIDIICNCDVLTTGFDVPDVYCIILATPIKSIIKAVQIYGRATRLNPNDPNKTALILDCAGVIDDTIHPLQRMRFDKPKQHKKKELCSRDGCGGKKVLIEKTCDNIPRDGFFLIEIKHKCNKCDAVYLSDKMEEIPASECLECGNEKDNTMIMKNEENEIIFLMVCNSCGAENEYRKILLTDGELIECGFKEEVTTWETVRYILRHAKNKDGKTYHWKFADRVIDDISTYCTPQQAMDEIKTFESRGWSLGAIRNAIGKKYAQPLQF